MKNCIITITLMVVYSSDQYVVNLLRSSCSSVTHFPDLPWTVVDLPCFSDVRFFTS